MAAPDSNQNDLNLGSVFWPVMILILGLGAHAVYQVLAMQDRLASITHAVHEMDPKVRQARYEQARLQGLAGDVLKLAPTDANAARLVEEFQIHPTQTNTGASAAPVNPSPSG